MISIVSLAWNQPQLTEDFLYRLKKYTDIDHELIFTDNGSETPISDIVLDYYPDAKLIRYEKNIGCPATRNPSMEKVSSDIVFWLDNDTYVETDWYKPYLDVLNKHENVGIVGVDGLRIRNPFSVGNPWNPNFQGNYCDWFVGYAVAFRKKAYRPIPDWGLMVNMDDVDLGVGIRLNGYSAYRLDEKPNLVHLTSQTAREVRPTSEKEKAVLSAWWEKYKDDKDYFLDYD